MRKIIIAFLLVLFSLNMAHAAMPTALEIYNQIHSLQPGTDVDVAYKLLGAPQEKYEGTKETPACLKWYSAIFNVEETFFVFYDDNNKRIDTVSYSETYDEFKTARQRYEVLKDGIFKILGTPVKDLVPINNLGWVTEWNVGDSTFILGCEEIDLGKSIKGSIVTIYFY